jgi:hypothetical protein
VGYSLLLKNQMANFQDCICLAAKIKVGLNRFDPDGVVLVYGSTSRLESNPDDLDLIVFSSLLSREALWLGYKDEFEYTEKNSGIEKWMCERLQVAQTTNIDVKIIDREYAENNLLWETFKLVQKDPYFLDNVLSNYLIMDSYGYTRYNSPSGLASRLQISSSTFGLDRNNYMLWLELLQLC